MGGLRAGGDRTGAADQRAELARPPAPPRTRTAAISMISHAVHVEIGGLQIEGDVVLEALPRAAGGWSSCSALNTSRGHRPPRASLAREHHRSGRGGRRAGDEPPTPRHQPRSIPSTAISTPRCGSTHTRLPWRAATRSRSASVAGARVGQRIGQLLVPLFQRISCGADALGEQLGHHALDRAVRPLHGPQVFDVEDESPGLLGVGVALVPLPGEAAKAGDEVVAGWRPCAPAAATAGSSCSAAERSSGIGIVGRRATTWSDEMT